MSSVARPCCTIGFCLGCFPFEKPCLHSPGTCIAPLCAYHRLEQTLQTIEEESRKKVAIEEESTEEESAEEESIEEESIEGEAIEDQMDDSESALDSPLSDHPSSEFGDDILTPAHNASEADEPTDAPPAKKQRVGAYGYIATPVAQSADDDGEISSDTEGSLPSDLAPEDYEIHEQVTVCKWKECTAGDLGNMDNLVIHIHDDHIGARQKKYACEWEGCSRIGMTHASGYALKAHMRSHTKEKPFFCALPECDKSFTRSDALAKHMRTVHETEALRPSDPVPRSHSTAGTKPQRLKLIVNAKPPSPSHSPAIEPGAEADIDDDATIATHEEEEEEYDSDRPISEFSPPSDCDFTEEELAMPIEELYKLLRMQLHWTEETHEELEKEVAELEGKHKMEWQKKELVLDNVLEAELAVADGKGDQELVDELAAALLPVKVLPMKGPFVPWYRQHAPAEAEAEAEAEAGPSKATET